MGWVPSLARVARHCGSAQARAMTTNMVSRKDQVLAARVARPELVKSAAFINGKWGAPAAADNMFEVLDPASGAVLGQVPLRRGFRAWRRQRGVRSALAVRRTAHQRRWALCRAWGCWRLAAATERARTPPPPSHEASAEMSPVQAQLHWRQPLLLRSC